MSSVLQHISVRIEDHGVSGADVSYLARRPRKRRLRQPISLIEHSSKISKFYSRRLTGITVENFTLIQPVSVSINDDGRILVLGHVQETHKQSVEVDYLLGKDRRCRREMSLHFLNNLNNI